MLTNQLKSLEARLGIELEIKKGEIYQEGPDTMHTLFVVPKKRD